MSKTVNDDACPTCGSKKFVAQKSPDSLATNQLFFKCNNCKKFWYSDISNS